MSNKIALLGDTHFGARNASEIFDAQARDFFENLFFPTLEARNIKSVIQLGDMFDNRKFINLGIGYRANEYFLEPIKKYDFVSIIGNHDSFYKNSLEINSQSLLMDIDTVHGASHIIVDVPMHIGAGLALPWICKDNYDTSMDVIKNTHAKFCFAHLELSGFKNNAHVMKEGLSPDIFKKFDKVFTGHYHSKQIQDNIMYVGTPYELTWTDCDDEKGFHILDLDTGDVEFIKNPNKMHHKVFYHEQNALAVPNITNKIVKVIVEKKTDKKLFDGFFKFLSDQNPAELKVSESIAEYNEEAAEDIDLDIDSTPVIIEKYINNCELSIDKGKLNDLFKELHEEAYHS